MNSPEYVPWAVQQEEALQEICAWCGTLAHCPYPVSQGGQTVFCCSEDHQQQLRNAVQ